MSDTSQGPGWWQASDGKWYPPEAATPTAPPAGPPAGAPAYGAPTGPPPGYGMPAAGGYASPAAASGELATWGQRVVAYLIDWALLVVGYIAVFVVALIFGAIADALGAIVALLGYLAVLGASFYFYYLNGETGQSPGKRLTGLKVVSQETGQTIGGGLGIVRGLAHFVDAIICYIGFLFPLWDPKKQTISDKIMKTVVTTGNPKQDFGPNLFKK